MTSLFLVYVCCLVACWTTTSQRRLGGINKNAVQLAASMKLGWNLGNTLEAIGGETNWGNPQATQQFIDFVKRQGFNSIRLPCSWDQYIVDRNTNKIRDSWLARVKQVVQMCINSGLYVVLNIHWDGGWLDGNITPQAQQQVNLKQKQLWTQIATYLNGFDNRLLFASANEPPVKTAAEMTILLSYHQTFINAVRATGGQNKRRVLVIQGPSTDISTTNKLMKTLPRDTIAGYLMVEVHYYSPYPFCLMAEDASWGTMSYFWGQSNMSPDASRNWKNGEADVDRDFGLMKQQFVDKGIPVILGEYGAIRRNTLSGQDLNRHLSSRKSYISDVVKSARRNGLIPFYWDDGYNGDKSFGLFDRRNNRVVDQMLVNAIISA